MNKSAVGKFCDSLFKLHENNTTIKAELIAGVTTFSTMAYIIFINPAILSSAGMDFSSVMVATIIAAALATLFMGVVANYPVALAPGMALNAYFAYYVVASQGLPWQAALGVVFIAGALLFLLNVFRIRELVIQAIPPCLRIAATGGIGLFIAFIGMKNAGVIVAHPATLVTSGNLADPQCYLTIFGVIVIGTLITYEVKGAILIGILLSWVIGLVTGLTQWQGLVAMPSSPAPTFMQLDFSTILTPTCLTILFAFFFISLLDTSGSLLGLGEQGHFLDKRGKLPRIHRALYPDAIGTMAGAALGTSTVNVYLESASGIAAGGKTGLTAVVVAVLFLTALFFEPLAASIPLFATSPVLIIIGSMMLKSLLHLNWKDPSDYIPSFVVLITVPLTYSIAMGLGFGFITYPFIKLFCGRFKEVHWLSWVLTALFLFKIFILDVKS